MKVCTSCGVKQPLDAFHRDARTKDGRTCYCRSCACEKARAWRAANPEQNKATKARCRKRNSRAYVATQARYREEHPEQTRQTQARYRERNKAPLREDGRRRYWQHVEERRAKSAQYCAEHAEEIRLRMARYRKAHPEIYRASSRRRRARKHAVNEVFTAEMERFLYAFWGSCAICGSQSQLSADHWLPLSGGHALTLGNAVLLCRACNSKKGAKQPAHAYPLTLVVAIEQQLAVQAQQWQLTA